ncbi:DUF4397 domain-containing protein [Clostridium sp. AM58-1XD]|uniref:DUF4397 domain-containing protein n=1 Tax=Clostridium sp. AM58-1XD TaxID=2292307 RepID=UPI000E53EF95|nr:DUF4397 domain-containing protein [Clostridium sp. AM58-1XD]RGY98426.1 DUF4397 domain-containing protein [Clostridium sp. AM58-1XD]
MNTVSYINDQNTPVIPLPNPGEGGPVDDGFTMPDDNFPVIPLPNPGEGGPVADPSDGSNIPVIPLPNPGEGGPVADGNTSGSWNPPGILGSIITVFPRPIIPCFFCNTTQYGTVRFLNAAAGYNPFLIYINNQLVVNSLDNADISQYGRVSSGSQTITVSGMNGYVYIQKQINVRAGSAMTVAIINTQSGLDLMTINDTQCQSGFGTGCFRVANLSVTNQNLNVSLNNFFSFRNVTYKEVTGFSYITTGNYTVRVYNNPSLTGNALVTSSMTLRSNTAYTLYIFNWNQSRDAIRTLIVEDRN